MTYLGVPSRFSAGYNYPFFIIARVSGGRPFIQERGFPECITSRYLSGELPNLVETPLSTAVQPFGCSDQKL